MNLVEKHLHIVSFDLPYPPSYGGVIDVFYKLRSLALSGVRITLHAFTKKDIKSYDQSFLRKYCRDIHIYERKMNWKKAIGTTPFIIASRDDEQLIRNLNADDAPILLEGMHTASVLRHPSLKGRRIFLRMHNIEWDYYSGLSRQEDGFWKRLYFKLESFRLERTASQLKRVSQLLTISKYEQILLSKKFDHCNYLPPFHSHDATSAITGSGDYALYHGNLAIAENRKAVEYLIEEVFAFIDLPFKIVGSGAPNSWLSSWKQKADFILQPDDATLVELIRQAQMNVLVSFQRTGVKLKLINALFCGRHCIVNTPMIEDSSLAPLCGIADDASSMQKLIISTATKKFTEEDLARRNSVLAEEFNNRVNGNQLIEWLYPHR